MFDKTKIVSVKSNDDLSKLKMKGIISYVKEDNCQTFKIDTKILPLSKFVKKLSTYNLEDLDVFNQNIDDIILNLYEEYL